MVNNDIREFVCTQADATQLKAVLYKGRRLLYLTFEFISASRIIFSEELHGVEVIPRKWYIRKYTL